MLELEFLPAYSPELNPDEQVWKNIKERVSKKLPQDKYDLRRMVNEAFAYLKKSSHIISGFFRHPDCVKFSL
jgi:transposase